MFTTLRIDASSFKDAASRLNNIGAATPDALRRAINHTGDKARTAMRIALVIQTGLKRKTMNKAIISTRASSKGQCSYVIKSHGGDVSLKYFAARETRAGRERSAVG